MAACMASADINTLRHEHVAALKRTPTSCMPTNRPFSRISLADTPSPSAFYQFLQLIRIPFQDRG